MPSFRKIEHGIGKFAAAIIIQVGFKVIIENYGLGYFSVNNSCNIMSNAISHGIDAAGIGNGGINNGIWIGNAFIFEIFVIDDETRKLIYDKATSTVLRARAREMGMRTLREDGIRKVLAGLTTAEEVIRSTLGDES